MSGAIRFVVVLVLGLALSTVSAAWWVRETAGAWTRLDARAPLAATGPLGALAVLAVLASIVTLIACCEALNAGRRPSRARRMDRR